MSGLCPILWPCDGHSVLSVCFSPLAATGPREGAEGSAHKQPLRALCQEQQAAGGAICTPEAELCEELTGKPTNVSGRCCVCPASSHLNLQSRLTKLSIWFTFIWLQNLTESWGQNSNFRGQTVPEGCGLPLSS